MGKPRYLRETHTAQAAAELALTRLQSQVDEDRHPKTDITVGRAIAQVAGEVWAHNPDTPGTTPRAAHSPTYGTDDAARIYSRVRSAWPPGRTHLAAPLPAGPGRRQ